MHYFARLFRLIPLLFLGACLVFCILGQLGMRLPDPDIIFKVADYIL